MKTQIQSHFGTQKMPPTQLYSLLDDQLLIFVRSWASQDYNQKFVDEIMHYLSTAQADIEITSPFDFQENLSTLTNKIRISLLLAHDYFYKTENKSSFSVGFETLVVMRHKQEIAWGSVGRFDIYSLKDNQINLISAVGTDRDQDVLLPIELIGVEKDVDIRLGSLRVDGQQLVASSLYKTQQHQFKFDSDANEDMIDSANQGSYWFSRIALD